MQARVFAILRFSLAAVACVMLGFWCIGVNRCKDVNLSQSLYQRRLLGGEAKLMHYARAFATLRFSLVVVACVMPGLWCIGANRCKDENLSQSLYQRRLLGGEAKLMHYQLKHRREDDCDIALFSCRC